MARRLWRARALDPLAGAWYGALVWIATSYHLRYAMFLPLAVVAAAYTLYVVLPRRRWAELLASIALLIGPTPAAAQYIKSNWARPIPIGDHPDPCLMSLVPAPARLYLVNLSPLKYSLERQGYRAIGDDFHDGRWTDFWRAMDARRPGAFLRSLPADYVVVCRLYPPDRTAQWHTTTETLANDSLLTPIVVDSVHAVFGIRR
jgi:hypothetical protein